MFSESVPCPSPPSFLLFLSLCVNVPTTLYARSILGGGIAVEQFTSRSKLELSKLNTVEAESDDTTEEETSYYKDTTLTLTGVYWEGFIEPWKLL